MDRPSRSKAAQLPIPPSLFAGYLSGVLSVVICAPLDTIRNRLQVEMFCEKRIKGMPLLRIAKDTIRTEGVVGLYRGLSVTLVALPMSQAVYFYTYAEGRKFWRSTGLSEFWSNFMSSGVAATITNFTTNPLWLARTRIMSEQLHLTNRYRSMFQTMALISKEEGVRALYQGISASMLGIIHVMVQFPLYEYMKQSTLTGPPTYTDMIYLSIVPKLIASLVSYPHEVLRSRLQDLNKRKENVAFGGLRQLVKATWREEGFRGFYAGYKVSLLRLVPGTYVTLTSYEKILSMVE